MAREWRMIVYSPRDFRYRRFPVEGRRGIKPGYFILAGLGLVFVCCFCGALFLLFRDRVPTSLPSPPSLSLPAQATLTPDRRTPVAIRTRAAADNGLELTVLDFQRPLKVEGLAKLPPDQQFILVSVRLRNTRSTGAPLQANPADFTVKGDGGLTYTANPKNVTIDRLLTQTPVAPGKDLTGELIFQIAVDDSALKLYWKTGSTTRVILLEAEQ